MLKLENLLILINGVLTVLTFLLLIFSGGIFSSLQAFLFREISFMISPYIEVKDLTVPIYATYNIFLFLFALLIGIRLKNSYAKLGAISLALASIVGIIVIWYPMDPNGDPGTIVGFRHNWIVVMMSLYIILSLTLFSYAFKKTRNLSDLSKYSLIVGVIISLTGLFTGIAAFMSLSRYVGIIERIPVASFLVWIVRTAYTMLRSDKRINYFFLRNKD